MIDKIYKKGTLDRLIYSPTPENYTRVQNTRLKPIYFPPDLTKKDFKFVSVSGSGKQTPLHVVYQIPVKEYSDLLYQKPEFVYGDGDGTVLLTSALGDPFPEKFVVDRIVVEGFEHFGSMSKPQMFDIVKDILENLK